MYAALEDIKLQTVDYEWIKSTTKVSHLKKAIKLIEADGDYFKQLKQACYQRLQQIDPKQKRLNVDNHATLQLKQNIEQQLNEWENNLQNNSNQKNIFDPNLQDYQTYFQKKDLPEHKTKMATNQRNKGNQATKSKDYKQAINYYTNSVNLDPTMYQSYGNRALAFLKIKQYQKSINDCNQAIKLNPKYTKAYHRKAKALIGMKKKVEAYKCLQEGSKIEPDNSQINGEIQQLWQEMTADQKASISRKQQSKSQFKRVMIEQDSDDQN